MLGSVYQAFSVDALYDVLFDDDANPRLMHGHELEYVAHPTIVEQQERSVGEVLHASLPAA
jgi:hypothetical protein